ncbi:hypothetical protein DEU56DRAFT_907952 [Suillus clintonianus]|uniref:uncharacterized protein n=1 Tax=Suillus clintonianus TaxID=1904413 RepID=UPI001B870133|nr:uncharacterized protein DEU56DRAFT_907952 [Suillus clintonianus]KAG2152775.1 hypothetical protein DEU56DRAFT_907952 [Suillus clintonianus]
MADSITNESRSVSRGRESFQSSGRGGIGNIRRSSISSDPRPVDSSSDSDSARGREQAVHPDRLFSVGRGGAGNMRSPSQEVGADHPQTVTILNEHAAVQAEYEQQVKKHHAESNPIHSSGRGGIGNISGSRSRSRGPTVHSTGRGGAGNIQYGAAASVDTTDEEERKKHAHTQARHSTGRGGAANLTNVHSPDIERVVHRHGEFESSGRGGVGNIRSRSASRDPSGRAPSRDTKEKHGIAALWSKVSHPSNPGSGDPGSREE